MKVRAVTGGRSISSPANGGVTVLSSTAVTLAAHSDHRKSILVANQGTSKLYVKLGTAATTSSWHFVLPPGGADDDGTGGTVSIDGYVGEVSVISSTSSGRVSYVEFG